MGIKSNSQEKQTWTAKNKSRKIINIGDLPKIPSFDPGGTHDLLRYYDKEAINRSNNLSQLMSAGYIKLIKKTNGTRIDTSDPTSVNSVEASDIYTRLQLYTRNEITVLTSIPTNNISTITEQPTTNHSGITNRNSIILVNNSSPMVFYLPNVVNFSEKTITIKKISDNHNIIVVAPRFRSRIIGNITDAANSIITAIFDTVAVVGEFIAVENAVNCFSSVYEIIQVSGNSYTVAGNVIDGSDPSAGETSDAICSHLSTETIDGNAALYLPPDVSGYEANVLQTQWDVVTLISNGSNWYIISKNIT